MLTVTFDELELNSVRAGLAGRIVAMNRQLDTLRNDPEHEDPLAADATWYAIRFAERARAKIEAAMLAQERGELVAMLKDSGDHYAGMDAA